MSIFQKFQAWKEPTRYFWSSIRSLNTMMDDRSQARRRLGQAQLNVVAGEGVAQLQEGEGSVANLTAKLGELGGEIANFFDEAVAGVAQVTGVELPPDLGLDGQFFQGMSDKDAQLTVSALGNLVAWHFHRSQVESSLGAAHRPGWRIVLHVLRLVFLFGWLLWLLAWIGFEVYTTTLQISVTLTCLLLVGSVVVHYWWEAAALVIPPLPAVLTAVFALVYTYFNNDEPQRCKDFVPLQKYREDVLQLQESASAASMPRFRHVLQTINQRLGRTVERAQEEYCNLRWRMMQLGL